MSENIDINVGIIKEEISINAANNIVEVNISTAPVTIINPQNYDLSQFTNTSPNPFIQQSTLSSYVPISRIITINGVAQDLSTNRSWTIPGTTWGSITGTLAAQTDLQSALDAKVPTTRTLTINGVTQDLSADRSWTIATGLTVGTTPISSGTVGRILFEGTGNVVQESANLFWDNTNGRLGIGGTPSTNTLDIQSSSGFPKTLLAFRRPTLGDWGLSLGNEAISNLYIGAVDVPANITSRYFWRANYNTAGVAANTFRPIDAALTTVPVVEIQGVLSTTAQYFSITSSGSTMGNLFNVKSTGNVLINTTTDAGFRLDVNGTSRLQGRITTTYNSSTTTGIVGAIGSGTDLFGLSHASEGYLLWLTSGFTSPNNYTNGFGLGLGNPNSSNIKLIANSLNITSTNITMPSNNITLGFGGANQHLIYNSTSPFVGFRYTNAGGWNFDLREESTGTQRFVIFGGTGNVALSSTTDAGFRLDVNGTARVTGAMTIGNSVITGNFGNLTLSNNGIAGVVLTFTNNRWGTSDLAVFGTQGAHADASSQIEIRSTTRGFLPPRMTTTQINAITSPAEGLMVYNTTISHMCVYQAGSWVKLSHSPM